MIDSYEALKLISAHRGDSIVIATQTSNNEWSLFSKNQDLDLMYSAAMGQASSVGLGLALALPNRKIIIFDGDGSLLMNLGTLVTIGDVGPTNLVHMLFENGLYRTTGGQRIPGRGKISFAGFARAAGYDHSYEFAEIEAFSAEITKILSEAGPTFVCLKLEGKKEKSTLPFTRTKKIISRFKRQISTMH